VSKRRIEAFSDGVFAIRSRSLLEIKVPSAGGRSLWHELGNLWPSFAAFVVLLHDRIIWVNHHGLYDRIRESTRALMF